MEIVSTIDPSLPRPFQAVVRGDDIFWIRPVYFVAGSTVSLNNGVDIALSNYEVLRSARGFGTVTFKGIIIAEVGRGNDDPFPGNTNGPPVNRPTYAISGMFGFDIGNPQLAIVVKSGKSKVLRLRRVTIFHPGQQDTPAVQSLFIANTPNGSSYTGFGAGSIGSFAIDSLTANAFSNTQATVGTSCTVGVVDSPTFIIEVGIVPQDTHNVVSPVSALILDYQGASNLQPISARNGEFITIGSDVDGTSHWGVGHTGFSLLAEFTEDPF